MSELGKLVQVDLRKVWEHEARDFSAWLVKPENLSLLSEQLGIEIEPFNVSFRLNNRRNFSDNLYFYNGVLYKKYD